MTPTRTPAPDPRRSLTPIEAVERLQEGNRRFVSEQLLERAWGDAVRASSTAQYPFAAVLGCIDSRVPVEKVFDQGIGDLFVARVAGNVLNEDILGSLEFACAVMGAAAVVVLGHTACGAVDGAIAGARLGSLTGLLQKIEPAIDRVRSVTADDTPGFADRVSEANVELVVEAIRQSSDVLRELEDSGRILVVGAVYDVSTGLVGFLNGGRETGSREERQSP